MKAAYFFFLNVYQLHEKGGYFIMQVSRKELVNYFRQKAKAVKYHFNQGELDLLLKYTWQRFHLEYGKLKICVPTKKEKSRHDSGFIQECKVVGKFNRKFFQLDKEKMKEKVEKNSIEFSEFRRLINCMDVVFEDSFNRSLGRIDPNLDFANEISIKKNF